jgi:aminopeptidase
MISMHNTRLLNTSFDPELTPGAVNAIATCLRIQPGEKVTLICDQACLTIGASLARELESRGLSWSGFILDALTARPLTDMPAPVLADMESSAVSIFAVQVQTGELQSRRQMTDVVNRRGMRHAHMVNITEEIVCEGLRADFNAVDALSQRVIEIVRAAKVIRGTTPAGTEIEVQLSSEFNWLKTSGIISPKKWGNLPGGEIFTTPGELNGVFVVDGVVGDYLCARYGLLRETPLTLTVEKNRLTRAHCVNKALETEFWDYCHTDENSDRVGEFAIGTNIGLTRVIGNILQDEKFPGIHIAFGDPYGFHTGAPWQSSTHIDVVGLGFDIWADELKLMEKGTFLL